MKVSSVLPHGPHPLDVFFAPRTVAVIGATETPNSVGRTTLWNLISSPFGGTVFPVNPKRDNVLGIKAYPSIADVPAEVDLAVVVTPAASVPQVIRECGQHGVKGAVVISAGFKEHGAAGVALEKQVLAEAEAAKIRLIGPNCLGVKNPLTGINATFARSMARPGNIAFLSQSGALCTSVLDWSFREQVGFSAFVSLGSMVDVNFGDLIHYLGMETRTKAILVYMESIGDARSFLSAAREVALSKPIIVIKAGRTAAGEKAAASHTGSLTGSDAVLDAAFHRTGVLRVDDISDLFDMAETLAKQPRPKGPRLAILTNAGGPAVLATDTLVLAGGQLSELSPETTEELNAVLPAAWSHANPIDILGDADPERYAKTLAIVAKDANADGLLVVLTPQAMTDPTRTAELLKPYAKIGKPVLASWMGGAEVAAGDAILGAAGIPTFAYPDTAARAFHYMWSYTNNLRALYETPQFPVEPDQAVRTKATALLDGVRATGRGLLTEFESKQLLALYGIPVVETRLAVTADDAVREAESLGFPVAVKLNSETITHKTDVGGVKLNLCDAGAVRAAFAAIEARVAAKDFLGVTVQRMVSAEGYELILGSSIDPQFGPVLLFGLGGELVEVFKDRALGLPPLNTTLARRMMQQTRIFTALKGVRGRAPVDLAGLDQILVRFSQLIVEQPWIAELDINPLMASADTLVALDARVVLHPSTMRGEDLPQPAIRPYPAQYISQWTTLKGLPVTIRPIRPEDEPLIVEFHKSLSDRSVYMRYLQALRLSQRVAHERLTRIVFNDYAREIALVAVAEGNIIVAVGRVVRIHGTNDAEMALIVNDLYQGHGLGTAIVGKAIEIGRAEKMHALRIDVSSENGAMLRIATKYGFQFIRELGSPTMSGELVL
ncbi:MAG: bifunctional acetate--CoA ligase family protein/GNAT family N-acetyltransferase [Bryobacteraceae bacterium]